MRKCGPEIVYINNYLQSCENMKIILKNAGEYPPHITQQQRIQIFDTAVTHKRIYPLKVNENAETLFSLLKERENPG